MKARVVVFSCNSVRIYVNPENLAELVQNGALVNPDLRLVRGLPPHCWKNSSGKVVPDTRKIKKFYKEKGLIPNGPSFLDKIMKRLRNIFKIDNS